MGSKIPNELHEQPCNSIETQRSVTVTYNNEGTAHVAIPNKHVKRIDTFLGRECALDLLALGLYPDAKEISEAESMRRACVLKLNMRPGCSKTTAVIVGDGKVPRLGALLAFTTRWNVFSIDPLMEFNPIEKGVRNLTVFKDKVQNIEKLDWGEQHPCRIVLCAPHSHVDFNIGAQLIKNSIHDPKLVAVVNAVASPCCMTQKLFDRDGEEVVCHQRYMDLGNWSTKASIMMWHHIERFW